MYINGNDVLTFQVINFVDNKISECFTLQVFPGCVKIDNHKEPDSIPELMKSRVKCLSAGVRGGVSSHPSPRIASPFCKTISANLLWRMLPGSGE